jgi:hypothetical protein
LTPHTFGGSDILVNNAGGAVSVGGATWFDATLFDATLEAWAES